MDKTTKFVKCKKCGRLLFKGKFWDVEIKCPKCGYIQALNGQDEKNLDILYKGDKLPQHIERSDRQ